ncbi:hypothetical protein GCM10022255_116440 [Dactylosporangium darangshiense]|uniref:Secreted protein n=1 Tax=Dactylosporangium darangshiense TaxID=579108 RepID=A0ABP8DW97_9ACTN
MLRKTRRNVLRGAIVAVAAVTGVALLGAPAFAATYGGTYSSTMACQVNGAAYILQHPGYHSFDCVPNGNGQVVLWVN